MTSDYYAHASERAREHEQSEPQVVQDRRALAELRAIVGEEAVEL